MKPKYEPPRKRPDGGYYPYSVDNCNGHVASPGNRSVCGLCGIHIDELRYTDEEEHTP